MIIIIVGWWYSNSSLLHHLPSLDDDVGKYVNIICLVVILLVHLLLQRNGESLLFDFSVGGEEKRIPRDSRACACMI